MPKTTGLAGPESERRLTPTERLHEVTLAFASRTASPPEHAVETTRNAKGQWQLSVTVRGHNLADVIAKARAASVELDEAFPYTNGGAA